MGRNKVRIALVIEKFAPAGGVEGAAWATAKALRAAGIEVEVFAREGEAQPGITLHALPVSKGWQPKRVLEFSRAASQAAPRGRFDAVHSFSRTRHQDIYRAGGGCHAAYMERAYGRVGAALRRLSPRHATLLTIEGAVLRDRSQWIQCNSAMVQREVTERYGVAPERIAVIPNGVDVQRFRPRPDDPEVAAFRDAEGGRDQVVWLLVGHGFARKGVDTAIRALAQSEEKETLLWVAGRSDPGPFRKLANELGLNDRIRFLGSDHDTALLYAAADGLLLPTRYDAFANVCLEAAATGIPVITSGANGAAEWLGAAGLCVEDPEDVGGFAAALVELSHPERRNEVGKAGRRKAEAQTWASAATELVHLYEKISP